MCDNGARKYELTSEMRVIRLHPDYPDTVYRIRAVRDFGEIRAGELGGFIGDESNLSHDGECWVGDDAMVFGHATILGNAQLYGCAMAYGYAVVREDAVLSGSAKAFGYADIRGDKRYDHGWILHHVGDMNHEFVGQNAIF